VPAEAVDAEARGGNPQKDVARDPCREWEIEEAARFVLAENGQRDEDNEKEERGNEENEKAEPAEEENEKEDLDHTMKD
jgi:hypothetical protein